MILSTSPPYSLPLGGGTAVVFEGYEGLISSSPPPSWSPPPSYNFLGKGVYIKTKFILSLTLLVSTYHDPFLFL